MEQIKKKKNPDSRIVVLMLDYSHLSAVSTGT